jgi:Tfp pilus assembly protein PilF
VSAPKRRPTVDRGAGAGAGAGPGSGRVRDLLFALAPVAISLVFYWNSLRNGFVMDDVPLILEDPRLRDLGRFFDLERGERILRYWSFHLDHALHGMDPGGYHLTNVLLHGLAGVVLFFYARNLFRHAGGIPGTDPAPGAGAAPPGRGAGAAPRGRGAAAVGPPSGWPELLALAASLLFIAHPMQTESVDGVANRKESLSLLFLLLALHRSLVPKRTLARSLEVAVYFTLSLLSKEPAIVFLPLAAAQDLVLRRRAFRDWLREDLRFYAAPILVAGGFLWLRQYGLRGALVPPEGRPTIFDLMNPGAFGLSPAERILTAFRVHLEYLRLLVWPLDPIVERELGPVRGIANPVGWISLGSLVALLALAWRMRRRVPLAAFGLLWLLVTPVPTLNYVPLNQIFAERYLYLPMVGFAVLLALALDRLARAAGRRRSLVLATATALLVALWFPVVHARNHDWKSVETLLEVTRRDNPRSPKTLYFHAMLLRSRGRIPDARADAEGAAALFPQSAKVWHLVADLRSAEGDTAGALEAYATAVARGARFATLRNDYGVLLLRSGRWEEGVQQLRGAVRRDSTDLDYRENLALALVGRDSTLAEGVAILERNVRGDPSRAYSWLLLTDAFLTHGDARSAERVLRSARQAIPGNPMLLYYEGYLREGYGRFADARRAYAEILALPDLKPAERGLAEAGLERVTGRPDREAPPAGESPRTP